MVPASTILKTLRVLSLRYSADFGRSRLVLFYIQNFEIKFAENKVFESPVKLFLEERTGAEAFKNNTPVDQRDIFSLKLFYSDITLRLKSSR